MFYLVCFDRGAGPIIVFSKQFFINFPSRVASELCAASKTLLQQTKVGLHDPETQIHKLEMCSEVGEDKDPTYFSTTMWQPRTVAWIKPSDILTYVCSWEDIQNFQSRLDVFRSNFDQSSNLEYFKEFVLLKTMTLIWRSNKMETGRECGTKEHILGELRRLYTMQENSEDIDVDSLFCDETWHPEGEEYKESSGWRCMGEQAARGYFLLQASASRGDPLTIDLIKRVHSILMSGSMENCGEFRSISAYADDYVFALPDTIDERMQTVVKSFEKNIKLTSEMYVVNVAVQLMLDFVTIHPFNNGNGRMCRLLFSYALQRMGFPFPVTFDSGHKKSYKHYITSLKQAQTRTKKGPMLQIALVSLNATLTNYDTFCQGDEL